MSEKISRKLIYIYLTDIGIVSSVKVSVLIYRSLHSF